MSLGSSGGSTKTTTKRDIPDPTREEKTLLGRMMDYTDQYYTPSGRFWDVTGRYYQPSDYFMSQVYNPYSPTEEFVTAMKDPYVSMLPYQEKVGQTLNQLAQRGVINSTIGQGAMDQLGRWAVERGAEMRNQTLQALEAARYKAAQDAWQRAIGGEKAYQDMMADELKRTLLGEEAMKGVYGDMWNRVFQPWSVMYQSRMGVPANVTQTAERSGGGLLGQLAGTAGTMGLSYALSNPTSVLTPLLSPFIGKII